MAIVVVAAGFVIVLASVPAARRRRSESIRRSVADGRCVVADDVPSRMWADPPGYYSCGDPAHAGRHATAQGANFCMYARHMDAREGVSG